MKTKQEQDQNKPAMSPEIQLWVSVIIVALHDSRMDFNDVSIVKRKALNHQTYYDFVDKKDFRISKKRTLNLVDCVESRMWFEKQDDQIGRAAFRERVLISVGGVSIKKKKKRRG